jgi:signal transduction histidine kinase
LSSITESENLNLTASQKKALFDAYATNERMILLVNDLLDVARIEEGRYGFSFTENDMVEVFQNIGEEYRNLATEKKVQFDFIMPEVPMKKFTFDKTKISLASHALLDNSFRYTKEGGKITLKLSQDSDYTFVEVSDTGIGIPKTQINRLFTKFFRADNAIALTPNGSGLGLYIVRNIVERHGGKIDVISEENVGTTIKLRFPINKEQIPKMEEGMS